MVGRDEGGDGTSISFRIMEGASESGKLGFPVSPKRQRGHDWGEVTVGHLACSGEPEAGPVSNQEEGAERVRGPHVLPGTRFSLPPSLEFTSWSAPITSCWDTCRVPPSGTPSLQVEPTVLTPDENRSCHSPNLDLWPLLFPDLPGVALRGSLLPSPPSSLSVFTDLISSLISLLLTECRRRRHL